MKKLILITTIALSGILNLNYLNASSMAPIKVTVTLPDGKKVRSEVTGDVADIIKTKFPNIETPVLFTIHEDKIFFSALAIIYNNKKNNDILIGFAAHKPGKNQIGVIKYGLDGKMKKFAKDGLALVTLPKDIESPISSLQITKPDEDGKFSLIGVFIEPDDKQKSIEVRFLSDGAIDSTFGQNGIEIKPLLK